jgi:hypothetical protein
MVVRAEFRVAALTTPAIIALEDKLDNDSSTAEGLLKNLVTNLYILT